MLLFIWLTHTTGHILELILSIQSLILDSCPGSQSAVHSANAMILGHPRNFIVSMLGAVLIYLVIAAVALLDALGVSENVVSKTRRHLNDPARQFLHCRVSRTYLYQSNAASCGFSSS